jgi:hypothetical protein
MKWNSIRAYNDDIKEKERTNKMYNYQILYIIFIIALSTVSTILQSTVATPKYISLCIESNLTIVSTEEHTKEYLCHKCVDANLTNNKNIICPNFPKVLLINVIMNWVPLSVFIVTTFHDNLLKQNIYNHQCILLSLFIIINCIRLLALINFYVVVLKSVDHIDSFNQLIKLQIKNILMDTAIGGITFLQPIITNIHRVDCFIKFSCTRCCTGCYNYLFHKSHLPSSNNKISHLSISENDNNFDNNFKKYEVAEV